MKTYVGLVVLSVAAFTACVHGACEKKYSDLNPGHSMCLTDNSAVTKQGVSAADKAEIVKLHNDARGKATPSATDLTKIIWSDELAKVAQKWSAQCKTGHDTYPDRMKSDLLRKVPGLDSSIGQNAAAGQRSWAEAFDGWHSEVKDFTYGSQSNSLHAVGHYTQIVQKDTQMVGCGYSECSSGGYGRYYVCNYATGQIDFNKPYTSGARCSACPNNCKNGICDCGGLLCQNGGKLNLKTCQCDCVSVFKGRDCSETECPPSDPSLCGKAQPYGYPKSYCGKFSNVAQECPIMCGKCKPGNAKPSSGNTGGSSSGGSSSSGGPPCKGADPSHCGKEQPYGYPKSFCGVYSNVPQECPKMCGKCS